MAAAEDRDYVSEVAGEVAKYLDSKEHIISAKAADELITRWQAADPGLLDGWLRTRSRQILRDYIYTVTLSRGARRGRQDQYGRFAAFAEGLALAQEEGAEKGREFYRYHSVTEGRVLVRKPLSDLTAGQVRQVSDRYRQSAEDNAFYARVYTAVCQRVEQHGPDAVVSDVYTAEQLENMFSRAGSGAAVPGAAPVRQLEGTVNQGGKQ